MKFFFCSEIRTHNHQIRKNRDQCQQIPRILHVHVCHYSLCSMQCLLNPTCYVMCARLRLTFLLLSKYRSHPVAFHQIYRVLYVTTQEIVTFNKILNRVTGSQSRNRDLMKVYNLCSQSIVSVILNMSQSKL